MTLSCISQHTTAETTRTTMAKSTKSSKPKSVTVPKKQIKALVKQLERNNKLLELSLQDDHQRRFVEGQIISNKKQISLWLVTLDRSQDLREKINRKKDRGNISVGKVKPIDYNIAATEGSLSTAHTSVKRISKNSRRKTRKNIEKLTSTLEKAFQEFGH